jgi:DNA-directed RNA polymerase specialized sigma24 family protein
MDELDAKLNQLVREACQHPRGTPLRQRRLTQIIRLTANKLWKDSVPYYQDALQQTWIYFCQNICERGTADPYDPSRSSLTTWLNAYLKRRLQDFYIESQKKKATTATGPSYISRSGEEETTDPIDTLPAEPDIPPILEAVQSWVAADTTGELRRIHIEGRPDVNCQLLILRRLPPETSWQELSQEFSLKVSTLSSFYQRKCMACLRKFGESEGYL